MKTKLNCVLLVDDDESTNFINKMVIEKAGITNNIETALNGKEAINFLTNNGKYEKGSECPFPQPMLILLDINMPIMDGWEFLTAYHNLHPSQKCKVIIVMLTTSLNPDDKIRAAHISEISGFKNKPLTLELVENIMTEYFGELL
jgi:CheY-like chemotaxis protein